MGGGGGGGGGLRTSWVEFLCIPLGVSMEVDVDRVGGPARVGRAAERLQGLL